MSVCDVVCDVNGPSREGKRKNGPGSFIYFADARARRVCVVQEWWKGQTHLSTHISTLAEEHVCSACITSDTFTHVTYTHARAYMYTATGGLRYYSHDYPYVVQKHPCISIWHFSTWRTYAHACIHVYSHRRKATSLTWLPACRLWTPRAYPFNTSTHYAHMHTYVYMCTATMPWRHYSRDYSRVI